MPFDPTPVTPRHRSRAGVHLTELRALEAALRAPMPEGFNWAFNHLLYHNHCGTTGCAIGLAQEIGLIDGIGKMMESYNGFGMNPDEFGMTFDCAENYGEDYAHNVRPEQVADAIAKIIAREEAADAVAEMADAG